MRKEEDIITGNLFSFYHRIAELCGYERGELEGCSYVWNRKGSWPGYLLGSPEPGRIAEPGRIQEIARAIRTKRVPAFWIMENPGRELYGRLEEHGIRAVKQWDGMILNPDQFTPADPDPAITIRSGDPATLEKWLQIVNKEVVTGAQIGGEVLEAFASSGDFHWMVAYLGDQLVSTGMVFSEGGIGGLYMLATRSSFRGRGIGTAVFSEMTAAAIRQGNEAVVLHGTGIGKKIYLRTGFREVNSYSVLWYLGL